VSFQTYWLGVPFVSAAVARIGNLCASDMPAWQGPLGGGGGVAGRSRLTEDAEADRRRCRRLPHQSMLRFTVHRYRTLVGLERKLRVHQ
jgi:hypothetical protein